MRQLNPPPAASRARRLRGRRPVLTLLLGLLGVPLAGAGCSHTPTAPAPEASTRIDYWEARQAEARVEAASYAGLFAAAAESLERFDFDPALVDYRGGRLTSEPLVSAQFFEFWRDEVRTVSDRLEASLGTVRRRVLFRLGRSEDDTFWLEPRVVVERQALLERRITNAVDYRSALGPGRQAGSRRSDLGEPIPSHYWYAVGRDDALERSLLNRIARRSGGRLAPVPRPQEMPAGDTPTNASAGAAISSGRGG